MVDKEERFCIFKENFDTTITEIEGPKYMTRAEAVERVAKEIFKAEICEGSGFNVKPSDFDPKDWDKKWANLSTDKKRIYYAAAEAALDALLG